MKLQDAEWVIPLLQAHLEGKTIQIRDSIVGWTDIQSHHHVAFNVEKGSYRIKPDTIKTKRFLWSLPGGEPHVLIVDHAANVQKPREKWEGFIRWIDTEWQEIEV